MCTISSHYLITATSLLSVLGSSVSLCPKPENEALMPTVIRLLGKRQKLDCGEIKIQLPVQESLESLKKKLAW